MKFLIINTDYPDFIESDYAKHPGLATKSFNEQLQHRYDTLFGMANFYSKNLEIFGHQAIDLFMNHEFIQRRWAKENNFNPDNPKKKWLKPALPGNDWMEHILAAQIEHYKPDVLYTMAMEALRPEYLRQLKARFRKVKIVGQHAAPITENMKDLSGYDLVLSSLPNYVEKFPAQRVKSRLFRLGFESSINEVIGNPENKYGTVHIGGYGPIHNERNEVLEKLAAKVPVDFWGYGQDNLRPKSPILTNFHGFAGGKDMYEILKQSRLTVTKHISSVAGNHANNMTLYEATGVGTLLIVDAQKDIAEIFKPGVEIITYKNASDLIKKVKYYLAHPDETRQIAQAGQARTLKDHTYSERMKELVKILKEEL